MQRTRHTPRNGSDFKTGRCGYITRPRRCFDQSKANCSRHEMEC
ncbi:hypothetical protein MIMGU_mgv1a0064511mg, partial [Erythranthe guttata]